MNYIFICHFISMNSPRQCFWMRQHRQVQSSDQHPTFPGFQGTARRRRTPWCWTKRRPRFGSRSSRFFRQMSATKRFQKGCYCNHLVTYLLWYTYCGTLKNVYAQVVRIYHVEMIFKFFHKYFFITTTYIFTFKIHWQTGKCIIV